MLESKPEFVCLASKSKLTPVKELAADANKMAAAGAGAAEADDTDSEEVTSDSDHVIEGDVDSISGDDDDGDSVAGSDDDAASSNPYALLSTDE